MKIIRAGAVSLRKFRPLPVAITRPLEFSDRLVNCPALSQAIVRGARNAQQAATHWRQRYPNSSADELQEIGDWMDCY